MGGWTVKKRLVMLMVLALAMAISVPALAAQKRIETNELLGVWKADDIEDLTVVIAPGSYAPVNSKSGQPELYAEATWQEGEDNQVQYLLMLNRWKASQNSFLNSLLGNTMANAIQTIGALGNGSKDAEHLNAFDYAHGLIGVNMYYDDENYEFISFTKEATGTFYAVQEKDGSVVLYWLDNYDPHIACVDLRRVTNVAPSADEVTQGVLRPVIDMADGAEAQAAIDVMRWTIEHQCARMDSAALKEGLRSAYAALTPADAMAFSSHYTKVSALMLDAMGLNPKTLSDPNRLKSFRDAGLGDALDKLDRTTESERAVDLLNAAVTAALK